MTTYQEALMNEYAKKYATNWFKFNEGSGTTLNDSKGTIVCTLVNDPTWLSNGGLSFDGTNDFIRTNGLRMPIGEKSIYLKLKINEKPTDAMIIISDYTTSSSNDRGYSLSVRGLNDGNILRLNAFSSWSRDYPNSRIKIESTIDICDGLEHDVLFTWNGTTNENGVKLFIDGILNNTATASGLDTTSNTALRDIYIGRNVFTGYEYYYKGEIHELSLFNKDLSKLALNKSLILSNGEYKKFGFEETLVYKNIIPNMTSNTLPSGVVSASSFASVSTEPWKAFTEDILVNRWATKSGEPLGWIQYKFPKSEIIRMYSVTANFISEERVYDIRDWVFEASNDQSNWTTLDNVTNQTFTVSERKEFLIPNNTPYLYYRLRILANMGGTLSSISRLEMMTEDVATGSSSWSTVSPTLPTSTQFLEQGMDDLASFNRTVQELEPLDMIDKTDILFTNGEVGKVYQKTINLQKYIDIRSIRTEVK